MYEKELDTRSERGSSQQATEEEAKRREYQRNVQQEALDRRGGLAAKASTDRVDPRILLHQRLARIEQGMADIRLLMESLPETFWQHPSALRIIQALLK